MRKYFLSFAMTLLLALAIVPAAFAATDVSNETELNNAITANNTINLTTDISVSDTVVVDQAVTINGNGHAITAAVDKIALKVTASGVTIDGLTVNTSSSSTAQQYNGYAIQCTAPDLVVKNSTLTSYTRGIDFSPASGDEPTLEVENTIIKNTGIDNYDTNVNYAYDCRGIATNNVKNGYIYIDSSQILGFRYSINAMVSPSDSTNPNSIRDGAGTIFDVYDTTIKGWTALNIWSADTEFYFTDCDLVGINKQSGATNHYSTIMANDMIYGHQENKASVVTFIGGSVTAARLGVCDETLFNVDYEFETEYVFERNASNQPVALKYYGPENEEGVIPQIIHGWNFHYLYENNQTMVNNYLDNKVTGFEDSDGSLLNVSLFGGTVEQYYASVGQVAPNALQASVLDSDDALYRQNHIGGDV